MPSPRGCGSCGRSRGATSIGRKIGFTNRNIWPEYGVFEPIWGDIYDTTVRSIVPGEQVGVTHLPEPRIEPEIVLGLEGEPAPGMSLAEIAGAIGWTAHGFEVVQSIFPGWRFQGCRLRRRWRAAWGAFRRAAAAGRQGDRAGLVESLSALTITLYRNDEAVDEGVGATCSTDRSRRWRIWSRCWARPHNPPLRAGEMVTTGTLTRAFPVGAGTLVDPHRWRGLARLAVEIG